ncbi:MAG: hypothetical protein ABRQ24_04520 [Syntrophomonadaceae bacterium]
MGKFNDLISVLFGHRSQVPNSNRYWDGILSCRVPELPNRREVFCKANQHVDRNIVKAFGSARPTPDQYLLHLAPGWQLNHNPVPVILIPGAGMDAVSFVNLYNLGYQGMQQQLVNLGYRVFAITFAHTHGDNFYQAEALAHAIEQVKAMCKTEQVDLVAHSKGGIAARIYMAGLSLHTPYRGDVRRCVMLGTPNLGTDFTFRNPSISLPIYLAGSNGVIAWDRINYLGAPINTALQAIYRDGAFPGQCQMLYKWSDQYALDMTQADWWTTYYGGQGFISHSRGIDTAIADGGDLITRLEKAGGGPGVELCVLAGNNHMFGPVPGDISAPSDGLVFVDSVFNTDAMVAGGARLKAKTTMGVNHLELLFYREVIRWIDQQLRS